MQRSGIRGLSWRGPIPDSATLHPGYVFGWDEGGWIAGCGGARVGRMSRRLFAGVRIHAFVNSSAGLLCSHGKDFPVARS
jgi:hypothetical protein